MLIRLFFHSYLGYSTRQSFLLKARGPSRAIGTLFHRLYLNAHLTKYCEDVFCICKAKLTVQHILLQCPQLSEFLPKEVIEKVLPSHDMKSFWEKLFASNSSIFSLASCLLHSPVGRFL